MPRKYIKGGSSKCQCGDPRANDQRYCVGCRKAYDQALAANAGPLRLLRRRARDVVRSALCRGTMVRLPCAECENPETKAFHCDFYQPRRVRWLCQDHAATHNPMEPVVT